MATCSGNGDDDGLVPAINVNLKFHYSGILNPLTQNPGSIFTNNVIKGTFTNIGCIGFCTCNTIALCRPRGALNFLYRTTRGFATLSTLAMNGVAPGGAFLYVRVNLKFHHSEVRNPHVWLGLCFLLDRIISSTILALIQGC